MNKTYFITGGAGFIANSIMQRLIPQGHSIIVYDNFTRDTLSKSGLNNHPNIKVVKGDVLDKSKLIKSMKGADAVIHAAGIAGIDAVVKSPVLTMKVNMIGTANVLEAALENQISDRVIDFSTSEVFGTNAYNSSEKDNTVSGSVGEARWSYSVSKLAGEHLAKAYHTEYDMPIVTVRPFNVYGPGQTGQGAIHTFINLALENETIYIDGDGSQIRAWCYVDDFVRAIIKCLEEPSAIGESFNIGNARDIITILGLANTVCRVLNSNSKIIHRDPLSADIAIRVPKLEKAKKILDYNAEIDLEEGIKRTAEWIKNKS